MKTLIKPKYLFVLLPFIFVFWKLALFLIYPMVSTDGPWTLSHLFSFMNGSFNSSTFAHDFDGSIYKTYALEMLLSPFYWVLGEVNTYKFIIIAFIFILSSVILIRKISFYFTESNFVFFLFSGAFLTSIYAYGMRSETYITPLLLVMVLLVFQLKLVGESLFKLILIGFLGAFAFLIHPASAIFTILLVFYTLLTKTINLKAFFWIVGSGLLASILISGFRLFNYIELFTSSNEMDNHSFSISHFLKYVSFTPIVLILFFLSTNKKSLTINSVFFVVFILMTCFFGRSYYFSYTIPFLLLLYLDQRKIKPRLYVRIGVLVLIGYGLYITHVFPTFQNIENPEFSSTYRSILSQTNKIGNKVKSKDKVWVSSQLGMEVIDQPNSRLHHHFYKTMSGEKITLKRGDVMLFWNANKVKERISSQVRHDFDELQIEEVIAPVKGHYKITKPFSERGDDIGLWLVCLKE